jgi:hypothetical protein
LFSDAVPCSVAAIPWSDTYATTNPSQATFNAGLKITNSTQCNGTTSQTGTFTIPVSRTTDNNKILLQWTWSPSVGSLFSFVLSFFCSLCLFIRFLSTQGQGTWYSCAVVQMLNSVEQAQFSCTQNSDCSKYRQHE